MYTRRKFLLETSLAAGGLLSTKFANAESTLRQRTSDSYPRSFKDDNGVWSGFEIDMSQLLCKRVGYQFEPLDKYMNWTRSLRSMQSGRIDFLTFVSYRQERTAFLDYIGPYDVEDLILLVHKDNELQVINSLQDLFETELPIEITKDAAVSDEFDRRFENEPDFASHFPAITSTGGENVLLRNQKMAARVECKRVSGAITDWYVFRDLINPIHSANELGYDVNNLAGISLPMLGSPPTYLTASLKLPHALRDSLRAAYAETRSNGEFDTLWHKWYGIRDRPPIT